MNLRAKPRLSYCGLTVVLRNPSRFDLKHGRLLSANGGNYFNDCLAPDFNIHQCDLRTREDREPLLPGTRAVLLLGEEAAQEWLGNKENTLNEIRGSVYSVNEIPHISSYFPQDAVDIKDYESTHNEEYEREEDEDDKAPVDEKRRHGKTKRRNFRFWLNRDIWKCKLILKNKIPVNPFPNPEYIIYPSSEVVISTLTRTKDKLLFFDIETDELNNIICFSYSFDDSNIYCVPALDYNYRWAYSNLPGIFRALAIAIENNIVVAHNGANFDFYVLGKKYRIGINRVKDTMLQQHRCFPEAEKSLGHCTSLWTFEPFHKDEGNSGYYTPEQVKAKLKYCGKDVYTMKLVYYAQLEHAKRIPGLQDSFDQVNSAIKPYLTTTFTGIPYDEKMVQEIMTENDALMMQYIRIINWFVGKNTIDELRKRFKSSLPGSNPQCCIYFHEKLGYPVVGKGKEKADGTRNPSLAKKNLYKLKLKQENPVIDLIIAYRETQKESGALKFNPLKRDENNAGDSEGTTSNIQSSNT